MLDCPKCKQPTIAPWRKMALGPAGWVTCKGCGVTVSVPWSAMFATAPVFIALVLAVTVFSSPGASAAVLLVGFVAYCWLQWKFVPLTYK